MYNPHMRAVIFTHMVTYTERIQFEDSSSISSVDLTDDSVESDVSDVAALLQSKPQPRVPLPQVNIIFSSILNIMLFLY